MAKSHAAALSPSLRALARKQAAVLAMCGEAERKSAAAVDSVQRSANAAQGIHYQLRELRALQGRVQTLVGRVQAVSDDLASCRQALGLPAPTTDGS